MNPQLYQWIDLAWAPMALIAVPRGYRMLGVAFVLICVFTLRLQLELMGSIGYPDGILGLLTVGLYERGLVVYGLVTGLFLVLAHYSPGVMHAVFLAAALSMYFLAFTLTMLVMLA